MLLSRAIVILSFNESLAEFVTTQQGFLLLTFIQIQHKLSNKEGHRGVFDSSLKVAMSDSQSFGINKEEERFVNLTRSLTYVLTTLHKKFNPKQLDLN